MTSYIQLNGSRYAYSLVGEGEPLILLHGFTGTKDTWHHVIKQLQHQFTILSIDLPGHGRTVTNRPKTMKAFANDLQKITEQLQFHSFHLLGYSLGGRAALSYANYFPSNIRSLILESSSPGLKTELEREQRRLNDEQLANKIMKNGLKEFVLFWENIPLFATQKHLPLTIQEQVRMERLSQREEGLSESLIYMGTGRQPSWWERLSDLEMPILLLAGEEDQKFVQINREMNKRMKNSTFHVVNDAGHTIHLEQVEIFVKIVMEYMKNISDTSEQL